MLETKTDVKKTALLLIDCQNDLIRVNEEPFNGVTRMAEAKGMIGKIANVVPVVRKAKMQ
jgi:nicotinamidase-related amidase